MPDQETLSAEALQGAKGEKANSPAEEKSTTGEPVSQATYATRDDLKALGEQLTKQLQEIGQRNRQSQRDIIENRVQSTVNDRLVETMKSMLPEGTDFNQLKRQAWIDSQMDQPSGGTDVDDGSPQAPSPPPGSGQSVINREIASILQEHGLTGDEPELVEYVQEHQGEPWYKSGPGFSEVAARIATRNQGDAASMLGTGSGQTPPRPDLEAAYVKEVRDLRTKGGFRSSREGMDALRQVKERFRKQGLAVDTIDLSKVL